MTGFVRDLRPIHRAHHAAIVTLGLLVVGLLECSRGSVSAQGFGAPSYLDAPNAFGVQRTVTLDGAPLQLTGPFFQSLGTNGRTCATCHVSSTGWTLSPADLQSRYDKTGGTDPVFRPNDGANSPAAAASATNATELRAAYSMLLNRGVIRVALPIPAGAQFTLAAVSDPYGNNNTSQLSLFRRPLPSTNLRFLTGVMFDGRESATQTGTLPISAPVSTQPILPQLVQDFENLIFDLGHQANDATLGHAQAMVPGLTTQQINQIVAFELNLATAQNVGSGVGSLSAGGALGGPYPLILQPFYVSINDSAGGDVFGNAFNPVSMTLFNGWQGSNNPQQASIARGQAVFNTFPLTVNAAGVTVNCTSCHGTPNVGNRSLFRTVNLGISDPVNSGAGSSLPVLPVYTLQNTATGATVQTTDPGLAMITGNWADIGKFRVPTLRGVAAQAPYFHNGMAADLQAVIDFYEGHFGFTLSGQQNSDLLAFLLSL